MNKKYFFFDVETTGKILDMKAPVTDLEKYPRITQLCFGTFTEDGECVKRFNHLIKPDGWVVPKEKFFIDNNMSTERCEEFGIPIAIALDEFCVDRHAADFSIAHNITFDSRIIRTELIRAQKVTDFTSKKVCTMMSSTKYCALPGYKWPKLTELHKKLFGVEFEGAHDAFNDVMATAKCFFELKKRGVINE